MAYPNAKHSHASEPSWAEWMNYALALAARGRGAVEPNPMVGAVVLDAQDQRVGEGWHDHFGGAHAEIHALKQAGSLAKGGTLIVTLEPCCHFGKTPPCSETVIRSGIRRVVAAMHDPFPRVAGGGFTQLKAAGIEVIVGIGEQEARDLNAPYLKRLQTGQPWVIGKWAMSLDGKIATQTGESQWITGEASRNRVHELRGQVDAIIVGRGTLVADDPLLTARPAGPRLAARIVVTASGHIPQQHFRLLATARDVPVIIVTEKPEHAHWVRWVTAGAEILGMPAPNGRIDLNDLLIELGRRGMTNVLVEGGAGLLGACLDAEILDEAWVFVAPLIIGGEKAPSPIAGYGVQRLTDAWQGKTIQTESLGDDFLIRVRFSRPEAA